MGSNNGQFTLKPAEVKKLIYHCQDLRERIIIRLLVHCGLRREEVSMIRIERIDWSRRRIDFTGKFKKESTVPVPPDLLQDIRFFIANRSDGWLFPAKKKKGDHLTITQINRIVSEIGKRAGLTSPNPKSTTGNINPHLLRHTFARLCKNAGLDLEATQRLMRHASIRTTFDTYGTMDFEQVQRNYETRFLETI